MTQARIVVAAVCKNGVVFTGDRHGHIIKDMVTVGFLKEMNKDYVSSEEQGFVDSNNIYWPRDEAWHVALAAGQIKSNHGTLYSEDLW